MLQLAIPVPNIQGKQDIEIEMTVNGKRQKMHFVIEVFPWDACEKSTEDRVDCIRDLIQGYGDDWMIYNIGIPTDKYVPLTFVKAEDWYRQRVLLMEAVRD
ncbi:MAG: hypothetical protein OEQ53_07745 [Saprospiraceae bacterium]|nr:hypothetical protein [Saprospiraceae bacterium]